MSGFHNEIMYADNVDFSGSTTPSKQVTLNGQLLIGSTVAPQIRVATLTAGTGITITNGAGSISIASTAGAFVWVDQGSSISVVAETGYFITATMTASLPVGPAQGDTILFNVVAAGTVLTIDAPGTDLIRIGNQVTSAGGTLVSTAQGDAIELVYRASDTTWHGQDVWGNWLFT